MYLAERWEAGLLRMIEKGGISGFYHAGRGHEGTEVAATMTLRTDDYLFYDHRGCAHLIAKGMDLVKLYGDFLGNALGSTRGLGAGIVHICDPEIGVMGQSGTLGGGHVLSAGAALSAKLRQTDQVALNFFGDGAANQGTFHEAANAAGAWQLPVIFVVQNNGWAVSVPVEEVSAGEGFAQRGAAYGMPGIEVDGMDPIAVYDVVEEAVARARRGDGPTLIEAKVVRLRGHYEGDPDRYRDRQLVESGHSRDPIKRLRQSLLEAGVLSETELNDLEDSVSDEVQQAAEAARRGEMPPRERLFDGLYAEDA